MCVCALQYAIILIILIIMQVAIGIAVYVNQSNAALVLRTAWNVANNPARVAIQDQLQCCGCDVYNQTTVGASGLAGQPCPDPKLFPLSVNTPCMDLMIAAIRSSYVSVGVVAVVFAFIEV